MKINPQASWCARESKASDSWYKNYIKWHMVVLNVDDDQEDREFFRDALREVDPTITCLMAKSGTEALVILE